MDACELFAVCTVGAFLRIGIPVLIIFGLGWLLGRNRRKPKDAGPEEPDLTEALARCRAGEHDLTWVRDLDNIPGKIEWCRTCGTAVSYLDIAEPSQKIESKPRIFAERKE